MSELKKITILHSNDLHGDFLAEEIDEKLVGGMSMLSGYVEKVRQENRHTVYCIAGDMLQGSMIDAEYRGISTIEIMNMLAPDVATVGNHEVDYGLAHLLFIDKCANFPIINANMHVKTNGAQMFPPYWVKKVNGLKILFIGVLTREVLLKTKKDDAVIGTMIEIEDAADSVKRVLNAYQSADIDLTVLLTHIGFEEDRKLAAALDPDLGVDIIIGGHSHTYLEKPEEVNHILIVQAGVGTNQIGRFDLTVDKTENRVVEYTWQTVEISDRNCPRDQRMEELIYTYKQEVDRIYGRVLTRFFRPLTHPGRIYETELGNLVADGLKEQLRIDLMMVASGSIRCETMGPIVTYLDFCEAFPFQEAVWMVYVTGKQLKKMLSYVFRDEVWQGVHCEFYQLSEGFRVTYARSTREFLKFSYQDQEIREDQLFQVGLQGYHYNNFENMFQVPMEEIEANGEPRKIATSYPEVLEAYFHNHQMLERKVEGRIEIL